MSDDGGFGGFGASSESVGSSEGGGMPEEPAGEEGIPPRYLTIGSLGMVLFLWGWSFMALYAPTTEPNQLPWYNVFVVVFGVAFLAYPAWSMWLLRRRRWALRVFVTIVTMAISVLIGIGFIWCINYGPGLLGFGCFMAGLLFVVPCLAGVYARLEKPNS